MFFNEVFYTKLSYEDIFRHKWPKKNFTFSVSFLKKYWIICFMKIREKN